MIVAAWVLAAIGGLMWFQVAALALTFHRLRRRATVGDAAHHVASLALLSCLTFLAFLAFNGARACAACAAAAAAPPAATVPAPAGGAATSAAARIGPERE